MAEYKGPKLTMKYSSFHEIYLENLEISYYFNVGPSLFNIFLTDLFLTLNNTEIVTYIDENILYCSIGHSNMMSPEKWKF